eukprot:scaffold189555_cov17-Tisochrysis_lutea.AAC.1
MKRTSIFRNCWLRAPLAKCTGANTHGTPRFPSSLPANHPGALLSHALAFVPSCTSCRQWRGTDVAVKVIMVRQAR